MHLILLTDALGRVLETVVSRCQLVRFDPLPAARIAAALEAEGVAGRRAPARARGWRSATPRGRAAWPRAEGARAARRGRARFVAAALRGRAAASRGGRCSSEPRRAAAEAEDAVAEPRGVERLELEPKGRERKAIERELEEAAKRDGRRARTEVLDLALTLTGAGLPRPGLPGRGAPEAVLASDRAVALAERARGRDPRRLREAAERCEDVRQALELNVSEDLALSALGLRLAALAGSPG